MLLLGIKAYRLADTEVTGQVLNCQLACSRLGRHDCEGGAHSAQAHAFELCGRTSGPLGPANHTSLSSP
jgi:hypothetical protein